MRVVVLVSSLLALSALAGCSGDTETDAAEKERLEQEAAAKEVTITVTSPDAGAEFEADTAIPLKVNTKKGAKATEADSVSWTIGAWHGEGAQTEASGLPSGAHTVEVEVTVDGETYASSVDITILEPAITSWVYAGTLEADVIVDTADYGSFDDHCSTAVSVNLESGVLSGSGVCAVFGDFGFDPIAFDMDGTVRGGTVSGALIMTFDGTEARTPYDGTGTSGDTIGASFDTTHRDSGDSVRIVGSWTAAPQ
jgi:hypothetical protein